MPFGLNNEEEQLIKPISLFHVIKMKISLKIVERSASPVLEQTAEGSFHCGRVAIHFRLFILKKNLYLHDFDDALFGV